MQNRETEIHATAVDYFASHPLGPDAQTRICLFLLMLKQANAMILVKNEFQPMDWAPYALLHQQYYKDIEMATLLHKSTQWSPNPFTYIDTSTIGMKFWSRINAHQYITNSITQDRLFYEHLALSHAFMSEVRLIPLFSQDYSLENKFYAALYAIENENGKQIQTQIRFLKEMDVPLSRDEKETIVNEKREMIGDLFLTLLMSVCQADKGPLTSVNPFPLWWLPDTRN